MPEEFWRKVDEVHVSQYPASKVGPDKIDRYRHLATENNTHLEINYISRFRESFSEMGTMESNLIKRIYSTCQIAHAWRCQAIYEGHIYRCSPSIMIARVLGDQNKIAPGTDGLKLTRSETFIHDFV